MARDLHKAHVRGLVIAIAAALIVVIGLIVMDRLETDTYGEPTTTVDPSFLSMPTITWNGHTYQQKTDASITPLLLLGYDKQTDEQKGFRQGGSSDFMLLLVIDHQDKTIYRMLLDRDTMTEVTTLGVTGRKTGSRVMQLCLAHNFGATPTDNNYYAAQAASNLLDGVPIEYSLSMNMGNISAFNHVLGGVTVTVEDDLSSLDPALVPGATLRLSDEQAYIFVHSRKQVSDGTNVSRMVRHTEYMTGAIDQLYSRLKGSASAANDLYNDMSELIHTNMTKGRLINEMNKAAYYTLDAQAVMSGEHIRNDKTNYMEFYPTEDSIMSWVVRAYYRQVD